MMRRDATKWIVRILLLMTVLAPSPVKAQKSLSDGADDLATKLAKSYGEGPEGRVAIVPLRKLGGGENLLGTYIAETLTNSFFEAGYRDIVERQMLDRAIQELKLNFTGMMDPESAKKVGKFVNADFVVAGTMTDLTVEVSVICRMVAVQTGEVVAVATTKIVKDDTVKSMLQQEMDSPASTTREPAGRGQATGELTQEVLGISFTLKSCTQRGGGVTCVLSITALEGDSQIRLWRRNSRLIDNAGQEVGPAIFSFSADRSLQTRFGIRSDVDVDLDLVRDITVTGNLRFEGVAVATGEVPLIEIQFGGLSQGGGVNRGSRTGVVQFRNVQVQR